MKTYQYLLLSLFLFLSYIFDQVNATTSQQAKKKKEINKIIKELQNRLTFHLKQRGIKIKSSTTKDKF